MQLIYLMFQNIKKLHLYYLNEKGQAATEFIVTLVLFMGIAFALIGLLKVFSIYGWRILDLVSSDIP